MTLIKVRNHDGHDVHFKPEDLVSLRDEPRGVTTDGEVRLRDGQRIALAPGQYAVLMASLKDAGVEFK